MTNSKAANTRNLRYKRPALASMGWDAMRTEQERPAKLKIIQSA